jgi:hypothetical protein
VRYARPHDGDGVLRRRHRRSSHQCRRHQKRRRSAEFRSLRTIQGFGCVADAAIGHSVLVVVLVEVVLDVVLGTVLVVVLVEVPDTLVLDVVLDTVLDVVLDVLVVVLVAVVVVVSSRGSQRHSCCGWHVDSAARCSPSPHSRSRQRPR